MERRICRVCEISQELIYMFGSEGDRIYRHFRIFTDISILPHDGLPAYICLNCSERLTSCKEFYDLLQHSEKKLRALIKRRENEGKKLLFETSTIIPMKNVIVHEPEILNCKTSNIIIDETHISSGIISTEPAIIEIIKAEHEQVNQGEVDMMEFVENDVDGDDNIEEDDNNFKDDDEFIIDNDCINVDLSENSQTEPNQLIFLKEDMWGDFHDYSKKCEDENVTQDENIETQLPVYTCDLCHDTFSSEEDLVDHSIKVHRNPVPFQGNRISNDVPDILFEKVYECDICGRKLTTPRSLALHKFTHNSDKSHNCTKCHKKFMNAAQLERHMKIHSDEKPFKCDLCTKSFVNEFNYKRHRFVHLTENVSSEKFFECDVCGDKFHSKVKLKAHEYVHTGEMPFPCNCCDDKFLTEAELIKHLNIHSDEGAKPFKCEICNRVYAKKYQLNTHMMTHDVEEEGMFKCDICEKVFIHSKRLAKHMRIHDDGHVRRYQCDQCPKEFFEKRNLIFHKYSHTGEKPYACTLCDKKFGNPALLVRHEKFHEQDTDKPYTCDKCFKSYSHMTCLRRHQRKSCGKNLIQCNFCNEKFDTADELCKHMPIHLD